MLGLLLLTAVFAAAISVFVISKENQRLVRERDLLLSDSDIIAAADTSQVYVRRLPVLAPLVFRYQVAYPRGTGLRVTLSEGEQSATRRLSEKNSLFLTDLPDDEETHHQGWFTVFVHNTSDGYICGIKSSGGAGSSTYSKLNRLGWLDELSRKTFIDEHQGVNRKIVETFPVTNETIILENFEQSDYTSGIPTTTNRILRITIHPVKRKPK